jgi:hypothetical protein
LKPKETLAINPVHSGTGEPLNIDFIRIGLLSKNYWNNLKISGYLVLTIIRKTVRKKGSIRMIVQLFWGFSVLFWSKSDQKSG